MSAEATHHLAIDLGASSGRVALGTVQGGRLGVEVLHRFPNGGVPVQGRLCWDILGLWREVLRGLRLAGERGLSISSVGVNSWAVDYGLLDSAGELLGGVRHYRDSRTDAVMERAFGLMPRGVLYARTGIQFLPFNTLFQLLSERPERLEAASTLLLVPDLLHHWLGARPVAEISNASTTQFYDPVKRAWAGDVLDALNLPVRLPPLVDAGTLLGELSDEVARETGLKGVQIVAPATHDTASAVAAVPAQGKDWAYVSSGTWSLVGVEVNAPVITPETLAHNLTNEAGVNGTTRLLKNVMGLWMVQECCRAWGRDDYAALYDEVGRLPAGGPQLDPDDARFLPAGLDMPQRVQAWCREHGQPEPQTHAEIVRTILDSLARRTAEVLDTLERVTGRSVRTVHVVGGGSQITPLNQLIADLSGRTVVAGPVEATLMGNLLVQAAALGVIRPDEVRGVVRASVELREFAPQRAKARAPA